MSDVTVARRKATNMVVDADQTLVEFSAAILKDPVSALSWGDKVFRAAAEKKVATEFLQLLDRLEAHDCPFGSLIPEAETSLTREVLRNAKTTAMSSSASSNLMETQLKLATANMLEAISSF